MKRYAIDVFMNSALTPEPFADVEMVSDADGDWVKHEEAQSEIDRLRAENEGMKAALVNIDKITRQLDKNNISKDDAIEQVNDEIDGALNPPNA